MVSKVPIHKFSEGRKQLSIKESQQGIIGCLQQYGHLLQSVFLRGV